MNDFEPMPPPRAPCQPEFAPKRRGVFAEKSGEPARLLADPVPIDLNALALLIRLRTAARVRSVPCHVVARVAQRARFLPDASIEWHGEIFHDNEDGRFGHAQTLKHSTAESLNRFRSEVARWGPAGGPASANPPAPAR